MPAQTTALGPWPQTVTLEAALCRGTPETDESQLAHLPGNLAATPVLVFFRQTQHELFRLWIGPGASRSAPGLEGPVTADDLPVPADDGVLVPNEYVREGPASDQGSTGAVDRG